MGKKKKELISGKKLEIGLLIFLIILLPILLMINLASDCKGPAFLNKMFDCEIERRPNDLNSFPNALLSPAKPVIYLYPEEETDVKVQLDYKGELVADFPQYDYELGGWEVRAFPNGKLINKADGLEYSYIFWEGQNDAMDWDLSEGFVVKGEDTQKFLQEVLPKMGLTPVEYNEFIVYWYPLMKDNPYNLIHFAGDQYVDLAPLTISPQEDSMLRVFMVFKALDEFVEIEPQEFEKFERKGFSVVEWGGAEIY